MLQLKQMAEEKTSDIARTGEVLLYKLKLLDVVDSLGSKMIRWGSSIFIAYLFASALKELAGKETYADVFVAVLGNLTFERGASYVAGGVGILYGLLERKFRRDKIETLAKRIQELEKTVDPKRSSSTLTPRGTTRPEDK